MITKIIFSCIVFVITIIPVNANLYASQDNNCPNRYLTLVNPIRGRDLWIDKSLRPLQDQYSLISEYNFPATWLLQYDVFLDKEILSEINNFNKNQELGVFLEVSEDLAKDARVIYPHNRPWFSPDVVFLSGYHQSERRRLIDTLFNKHKENFGLYPKSVGSWWIDSYSLQYMKDKYHIVAAMIVADQKTTDNYGVWGQWWGVPYYPSKSNILVPAGNLSNKQDVVVLQWAQRDPLLAYGESPKYSNYSLQANDYIRQGKNTGYFKEIANAYLDCRNPLGQITVGLETGIESVGYIEEYRNQLETLKQINNLNVVTMNNFADRFAEVYPTFPNNITLSYLNSTWELSIKERKNNLLNDYINYQNNGSFRDYFIPDKENFLNRDISTNSNLSRQWYPLYFILIVLTGLYSLLKRRLWVWIISNLLVFSAFGQILRSYYQYGWKIYFGPVLGDLAITQATLILTSFLLIWLISNIIRLRYKFSLQKCTLFLLGFPLIYAIDPIIRAARATLISGSYYFGFAVDAFGFIGLKFTKPFALSFINTDFPSYQAAALLKIDFDKIWTNNVTALFIYPSAHLLLGLLLGYILVKFSFKLRTIAIVLLSLLLMVHLAGIFLSDPREAILIQ